MRVIINKIVNLKIIIKVALRLPLEINLLPKATALRLFHLPQQVCPHLMRVMVALMRVKSPFNKFDKVASVRHNEAIHMSCEWPF
jgi:hypothetical protein